MQEFDPKLIEHLLNAPRQEVIDYFKALPPEEREELGNAVAKAQADLLCQELVANLNRNVLADQRKREEAHPQKNYDPNWIGFLLDAPQQEVIVYLHSLPAEERKQLGDALLKAHCARLSQQLASSRNRRVTAAQKS